MPRTNRLRQAAGHSLTGIGVIGGLAAGLTAGVALPATPWIGGLVAAFFTVALGALGFLWSGEVFAASCPCCLHRTVTTTWRTTFQCRRCRTMCALAALHRTGHLRSIPTGRG